MEVKSFVCLGGIVEKDRAGKELSILTAWWTKLSLSVLVVARRLFSLLADGSKMKKLVE